jgi:putative hydrolase of HD superfamily
MGEPEQVIDFLHQAEKLKTILRHSWLSSGRRESVAEHTWRMALMAMLLHSYLDKEVDLLKTIKMILAHDLAEINYKDNPAFKKLPHDMVAQERKSLSKLTRSLPRSLGIELMSLWEEFEAGISAEAHFAKALDKMEVLLQHNEADIKYLTKKEFAFNLEYGIEHCSYDNFLQNFRAIMNQEFLKNYKKNKISKELYS